MRGDAVVGNDGDDGADVRAEIQAALQGFLARYSPESEVRRVMQTDLGYDPLLWRKLAEQLGVAGLAIPERYGGIGLGVTELAVAFYEAGRSLLCAPLLSTALSSTALMLLADEATRTWLLPELAAGTRTSTVTLDVGSRSWTLTALPHAWIDDGQWRINGEVPFTLDGATADCLLVPARISSGTALFLVAPEADVQRVPLPTMDLTRRLARITFPGAAASLIGSSRDDRWLATLWGTAVALLAAEQTGGAAHTLAITADYARTRIQFGRAIGSFQAVKHRLADMLIAVELARSAADAAASSAARHDNDLPLTAALAGSCCSETFVFVASECIQLHGGIGFTWEHPAHLYLKRAKSAELMLGSPVEHRRHLARCLGLVA